MKCQYRVRHRQPIEECTIEYISDTPNNTDDRNMKRKRKAFYRVVFDVAQRAATPGQILALYDKDICLGGGIIEWIAPSYYHSEREMPSRRSKDVFDWANNPRYHPHQQDTKKKQEYVSSGM